MLYSPGFLHADRFTASEEGGWADHAFDRGKLTRFGIASASHPDVNLATLTEEGAREIRYARYWIPGGCDGFTWPVSLAAYDWYIHSGDPRYRSWCEKEIQKLSGVDPDGDTGKKTIAAVQAYAAQHGAVEMAGQLLAIRVGAWASGFLLGKFAPSVIAGVAYPLGHPVRVKAGLWCLRGFSNRALRIGHEFHTEE